MLDSPGEILLSKSALRNNLRFFRRQFGKDVRISSVVKGNAYGHGIEVYGPLALECGFDHFSVFSADEAFRLHQAIGNAAPIMIMGFVDEEAMEWAIQEGIEFWIFDLPRLKKALSLSNRLNLKAKIHLEVETGMHRTGLERKEWKSAAKLLLEHKDEYELKGICTHFAGAESISNYVRIKEQKRVYREALAWFRRNKLEPEYRHACCSAAAIRYPEMRYDMVRLGILQYGFWPSREIFIEFLKDRADKRSPIKRLITWRSVVMSLKEVEAGEFIGYGTSYFTGIKTKLALVPIGYSGGFSRSLSNHGRVLINGKRAAVVGTVNMNCLCVDISEIPHVKPGDEVIIVGKQGNLELTVSAFTEMSQQLNYEALTRIPEVVKRSVIE